jgi:ABC-type transport system involved in multi-copper enzyme maturation permease subunit
VGAELFKLSRQGTAWAMLAIAAVLLAVTMATLASSGGMRHIESHPLPFVRGVVDVLQLLFSAGAGIVLLILSARLVGMEYSNGTLRVLLAGGAGRLRLLAAKLIALALVGLALLAGYTVICAACLALIVRSWTGSMAPLADLHPSIWQAIAVALPYPLVSMGVCILVGAAASTAGHSLAFGLAAALALFPADNFTTALLGFAGQVTGQRAWPEVTRWLLGPNLNAMPGVFQTDHPALDALPSPVLPVDRTHVLVVITLYAVAIAGVALTLTRRRDVRE